MTTPHRSTPIARLSFLFVAMAVAAGCSDPSAHGYEPFEPTSYEARREATIALHDMGELSDDVYPTAAVATYGSILSIYQAKLPQVVPEQTMQQAMQALVDTHTYGPANFGAYLDGQMMAAIALGAAADESSLTPLRDLGWAHESVEYFGLVYTYLTTYSELGARSRNGLDRAWGTYSFVPLDDGTTIGLFANAEEREPLFDVELNAPIEALFADAQSIVAANTTGSDDAVGASAALDATIDAIDRGMLRIFAYGCRRYLERLRDDPTTGADGNLIEGRVLWLALRPYAEHTNPAAANAVTLALYPTGEAAPADAGLHVAYGLAPYATGSYDGTASAGIAGLATITAALEAP